MISEFSSVKSNYFLIPCVSIMINDFYCVKLMTFDRTKEASMSYCFHSIGNLLHHWKVHCQWPSDTHAIDPDSDELIDSLVEANDILLERVVSFWRLLSLLLGWRLIFINKNICLIRTQTSMRLQAWNQTKQTRQLLELLGNKERQLCQVGTELRYSVNTQ